MSREGHYQILCRAGHYQESVGSVDFEAWSCKETTVERSFCGDPLVWWSLINDTNGLVDGWIEIHERVPARGHTCSCGHVHIVEGAKYLVPEGGHRVM